jgi:hypothetical protein
MYAQEGRGKERLHRSQIYGFHPAHKGDPKEQDTGG